MLVTPYPAPSSDLVSHYLTSRVINILPPALIIVRLSSELTHGGTPHYLITTNYRHGVPGQAKRKKLISLFALGAVCSDQVEKLNIFPSN